MSTGMEINKFDILDTSLWLFVFITAFQFNCAYGIYEKIKAKVFVNSLKHVLDP